MNGRRVIIAGAGPAGATLAYLLARRGIGVTLLERQTDFAREFRGEVLMPSGIDALAQAGLGTHLEALPHLRFKQVQMFRGPYLLATIPMSALGGGPCVVPQPAMLEMIAGEAAKFPSFALERGVTVRDVTIENGRAIGLAADTPAGPREFHADLIVGADGRTSVIRKRLGLKEERILQGFDVVWAKVPGGFLDRLTAGFCIGRGHLFIIYPSPEDHLQLGWVIKKGTFGDFRKMGGDGWFGEMAPYLPRVLREYLSAHRNALRHPVLLDVICDRLVNWTAPGVLLVGDAAHPMSPVGGQGINVALRDAIVAANHLGAALANGGDAAALDAAARRVQAERAREVTEIQDLQQLGPQILFGETIVSRIALSAPVLWLVRTFLAPTLARRIDPFLHGVVPVRLES
jgi:2-polyprenyl-6-methoxyphenol hydroxylase-like FAD-dependent oxidoreductase